MAHETSMALEELLRMAQLRDDVDVLWQWVRVLLVLLASMLV
jgi:hypothetical protein